MKFARLWVRLASLLVPVRERADWTEEWMAELTVNDGTMSHAWGALTDAWYLRTEGWTMDAIRIYGEQVGRLSSEERVRLLDLFDDVTSRIPDRPRAEVEQEFDEVSNARRQGGRGSADLP